MRIKLLVNALVKRAASVLLLLLLLLLLLHVQVVMCYVRGSGAPRTIPWRHCCSPSGGDTRLQPALPSWTHAATAKSQMCR
jgi:hypothetical protein